MPSGEILVGDYLEEVSAFELIILILAMSLSLAGFFDQSIRPAVSQTSGFFINAARHICCGCGTQFNIFSDGRRASEKA